MTPLSHPQLHVLEYVVDHEQEGAARPAAATKLGTPGEVAEQAAALVAAGLLRPGAADGTFTATERGRTTVEAARAQLARRRTACRDQLLAWVALTVDEAGGQPAPRMSFAGLHDGEPFTPREVAMAALFLDDSGLIASMDAPGEPNLLVWPTGPGRDCLAQGGVESHLALAQKYGLS